MKDGASDILEDTWKDIGGPDHIKGFLQNIEEKRIVKRNVSEGVIEFASELLKPEMDDNILGKYNPNKREVMEYLKLLYNTSTMTWMGHMSPQATIVRRFCALVAAKRYITLTDDDFLKTYYLEELKRDREYRSMPWGDATYG